MDLNYNLTQCGFIYGTKDRSQLPMVRAQNYQRLREMGSFDRNWRGQRTGPPPRSQPRGNGSSRRFNGPPRASNGATHANVRRDNSPRRQEN